MKRKYAMCDISEYGIEENPSIRILALASGLAGRQLNPILAAVGWGTVDWTLVKKKNQKGQWTDYIANGGPSLDTFKTQSRHNQDAIETIK